MISQRKIAALCYYCCCYYYYFYDNDDDDDDDGGGDWELRHCCCSCCCCYDNNDENNDKLFCTLSSYRTYLHNPVDRTRSIASVRCNGTETNLAQCQHVWNETADDLCLPEDVAGVVCYPSQYSG